jgi:hypothetical protein
VRTRSGTNMQRLCSAERRVIASGSVLYQSSITNGVSMPDVGKSADAAGRSQGWSPMPLTLPRVNCLHKLWGSQSWLQPAFSRRSRGTNTRRRPDKPPKRRLRARLPAPRPANRFAGTKFGPLRPPKRGIGKRLDRSRGRSTGQSQEFGPLCNLRLDRLTTPQFVQNCRPEAK